MRHRCRVSSSVINRQTRLSACLRALPSLVSHFCHFFAYTINSLAIATGSGGAWLSNSALTCNHKGVPLDASQSCSPIVTLFRFGGFSYSPCSLAKIKVERFRTSIRTQISIYTHLITHPISRAAGAEDTSLVDHGFDPERPSALRSGCYLTREYLD